MSTKQNIFRGPALWTMIAGVAIGAGSMYYGFTGSGKSLAFAQPPAQTRQVALTKMESLATVKALDNGFATLAEYAEPAVVLIKSESKSTPGLNGALAMPRGGEGSGVIFRPDGYIVTNDHVVGGFDKVTVVLKDGREFPGKVIRAEESDIAVVKIDATNLKTLPFADSSKVRPGEFAMAIGAPFGWENSVTIGHISALGRQNSIADPITGKSRFYADLIQTDAAINMGNSGGPLINVDGEVVGINSSIMSPNGTSAGIGFAISSNQARMLAETLIEKGKITRSYLGLIPNDLKDYQKDKMGLRGGALVTQVPSDGPAASAGIKSNDVIVRIGTLPINSQLDLRNAMLKYTPGTAVDIEVVRGGEHKTLQAKLIEAPERLTQAEPMPNTGGTPFGNSEVPDLKDFMKQFERGGEDNGSTSPRIGSPRLGVGVQSVDETVRKQFHLPSAATGAVVTSVEPGSIAEKLGLQAGDLIQEFDGKKITSADDIRDLVSRARWGDTKRIKFSRFSENTAVNQERDVTFR